jgi:hypothetical protein
VANLARAFSHKENDFTNLLSPRVLDFSEARFLLADSDLNPRDFVRGEVNIHRIVAHGEVDHRLAPVVDLPGKCRRNYQPKPHAGRSASRFHQMKND